MNETEAKRVFADMSAAELRTRAQSRLYASPPAVFDTGPSDDDLNPGLSDPIAMPPLRAAAVLIPVVTRASPSVILTLRTVHLSMHAGQIAFPGGKVDGGESATQTALREAHEEIGLHAHCVEPLGFLDWYRTRTGFAIAPLVAFVEPDYEARANPAEVDDIFEVPLAFLLDEANHVRHQGTWRGTVRNYHAMPYGDRYIWGATAGIIRNLFQRLTHE